MTAPAPRPPPGGALTRRYGDARAVFPAVLPARPRTGRPNRDRATGRFALAPRGRPRGRTAEQPSLLLVEDEALIQDLLETVLSEEGFRVACAATGRQALELLQTGERFRGMITDVRLSDGHTGWGLARAARARLPEVAVVYVTGDAEADWKSEGVPGSVLIVKPFAPAQVVAAMASLLNRGPGA